MFKKNSTGGPQHGIAGGTTRIRNGWIALTCLSFLLAMTGCQTVPNLPPLDLSEQGWTTRQGQAIWSANREAPEIAGEILVATNTDGRSFVQFTKTPLPFVVAETTRTGWQIHSAMNNRTYAGHGEPPGRVLWFHLPQCLAGSPPPRPWSWVAQPDGGWLLENQSNGEKLQGYLNP